MLSRGYSPGTSSRPPGQRLGPNPVYSTSTSCATTGGHTSGPACRMILVKVVWRSASPRPRECRKSRLVSKGGHRNPAAPMPGRIPTDPLSPIRPIWASSRLRQVHLILNDRGVAQDNARWNQRPPSMGVGKVSGNGRESVFEALTGPGSWPPY